MIKKFRQPIIIIVALVGLISALILLRLSQDVRSRAYTPSPSAGNSPLLGVNYTHYSINNCSLENTGILFSYHLPNVRTTVRQQLAVMNGGGVQSLRFMVWHMSSIDKGGGNLHTWGVVPSSGGDLSEPYKTNLINFLRDVREAGFTRLTVAFGPQWTNNPLETNYDQGKFEENWNFIAHLRPLIKQYGPQDTRIDLLNEGLPSQYQSRYATILQYVVRLYQNYVANFGNEDVSYSFPSPSDSNGASDRLRNFLQALQTQVGAYPKWFDIHLYGNDNTNTILADLRATDTLLNSYQLAQPLVIGESYYDSIKLAQAVSQFATTSKRPIEEITSWPITLAAKQQKAACTTMSETPPYRISSIKSALTIPIPQTDSKGPNIIITRSDSNSNLYTLAATWNKSTTSNSTKVINVCVSIDNGPLKLIANDGVNAKQIPSTFITWFRPKLTYTFYLFEDTQMRCLGGVPLKNVTFRLP